MKVHFIAIGGSVMHNLALSLRKKGYNVSGSDDEIFEPSRSRLASAGLLPAAMGWDPERIDGSLDAVILGMHAKADNPELKKARDLGIPIYSYPEYVYEQSKEKKRVVIGGSHGKTTITAMVMHVLRHCRKEFDYLVGANLEGFDLMVKLTRDAPMIILEGDEYLSSAIERRPKFHFYRPHIALISGIAWDHINVFPSFDEYVHQFEQFANLIEEGGQLIYFRDDETLAGIAAGASVESIGYTTPDFTVDNHVTWLRVNGDRIPLKIFGRHNLQNLEGARLVCARLGIANADFYEAIRSFSGAARRLETVASNADTTVFKDFAHSPSKLTATIHAVREQFPDRKLVACMELHTYSSLNRSFLDQYKGSMDLADEGIVYYDRHTLQMKDLDNITTEEIRDAFGNDQLEVFTEQKAMVGELEKKAWKGRNLLMMSSGNFDGLNINELAKFVLS